MERSQTSTISVVNGIVQSGINLEMNETLGSARVVIGGQLYSGVVDDMPLMVTSNLFPSSSLIGTINSDFVDDVLYWTSSGDMATKRGLNFYFSTLFSLTGTYSINLQRLDGTPVSNGLNGVIVVTVTGISQK